jgi:polysaccharide biosynthesis/export protein
VAVGQAVRQASVLCIAVFHKRNVLYRLLLPTNNVGIAMTCDPEKDRFVNKIRFPAYRQRQARNDVKLAITIITITQITVRIKPLIIMLAVAMAFASCNRRSQLLYVQNIDMATEMPFAKPPEYKLKHGDILYIQLVTHSPVISQAFNNPTGVQFIGSSRDESSLYLSGYSINNEGYVNLPFLGDAQVAGLNIEQARTVIQEKTEALYKDASVIVKLASFKITFIGEVRRPGNIRNFNDNLTIFEALASVGDISENGDRKNVLVVRPTSEGNRTYRLNLNDRSVLSSEAYYLLPNDVVIVEPLGNKVFQMNIPYINLTLSSISTIILLYNFITKL